MNFKEFFHKSVKQESVFDRPDFDYVTNAVKWLAMRVSYVLYKCGFNANIIDVLSLLGVIIGFLFMLQMKHGNHFLPIIGLMLLYAHIFIDFVDGPLAKARGEQGPIGHAFDLIGCDIDRVLLFVMLGILSEGDAWIISGATIGLISVFFIPMTRPHLPTIGMAAKIVSVYCNRYSFFSVRFMLTILPLVIIILYYSSVPINTLSRILVTSYGILTIGWLLLCVPFYKQAMSSITSKESIN